MLYRPPNRQLWDTLIYRDDDAYHLFFLQEGGLGRAVSTDLTTWTPLPDIELRGQPGEWNESGIPLTGWVIKHEGRYHLFGGALAPGTGESVYGLFTSDDLVEWEPHPANPVLRAPESFGHDPANRRDGGMFNSWRDPFIVKGSDGRFHAYLCSRIGPWTEARTGAVIAHASSADLVSWEHHEPLLETDRVKYTEVPGLFELDGRHYAYFLDHGWGGLRIHTPTRPDSGGTYYLIADAPEGPYEWPEDPLLIGSGHDQAGAWASRTVEHDDGLLLFHHVSAARPALGSLKRIRSRPDGTLYLEYFPGIESLESGEVRGTAEWRERRDDVGVWTRSGDGVSGRSRVVGSSSILAPDRSDVNLECTIRLDSGARAGVVLRSADAVDDGWEFRAGLVVSLDAELREVRIEMLERSPFEGWGWSPYAARDRELDSVRVDLEHGRPYRLRCVVRAEFVDVYLDDRWLFSRAMKRAAASGDVELMVERGEASFDEIRLAELPALP